jgi:hypothetical protein
MLHYDEYYIKQRANMKNNFQPFEIYDYYELYAMH